jgi:hypothetical protein
MYFKLHTGNLPKAPVLFFFLQILHRCGAGAVPVRCRCGKP